MTKIRQTIIATSVLTIILAVVSLILFNFITLSVDFCIWHAIDQGPAVMINIHIYEMFTSNNSYYVIGAILLLTSTFCALLTNIAALVSISSRQSVLTVQIINIIAMSCFFAVNITFPFSIIIHISLFMLILSAVGLAFIIALKTTKQKT